MVKSVLLADNITLLALRLSQKNVGESIWFVFFKFLPQKKKKCVGVICHSSALFLLCGSPAALQSGQSCLNEPLVCFCNSQKQLFPVWDQQITVAAVTAQHSSIYDEISFKLEPGQRNNSKCDAALNYFLFSPFSRLFTANSFDYIDEDAFLGLPHLEYL